MFGDREIKGDVMEYLLYVLIVLAASLIGALCGAGGGVIIKPLLDAVSDFSVSQVSFMSGMTVFAMSLFSVAAAGRSKEQMIDWKMSGFLGIGAAAGGICGKMLFEQIKQLYNEAYVGICQSAVLACITLIPLFYMLFQSKIKTYKLQNPVFAIFVGLVLGILSSFLGIGGGPINLVVILFCFSMSNKQAVQNSLYVILISQALSFLTSVLTQSIPQVNPVLTACLIVAAIGGAYGGRLINRKIDNAKVRYLLIGMSAFISCLSLFNVYRYFLQL